MIVPQTIGRRCGGGIVCGADNAIFAATGEGNAHTRNATFAIVLDTVAIGIVENLVSQGTGSFSTDFRSDGKSPVRGFQVSWSTGVVEPTPTGDAVKFFVAGFIGEISDRKTLGIPVGSVLPTGKVDQIVGQAVAVELLDGSTGVTLVARIDSEVIVTFDAIEIGVGEINLPPSRLLGIVFGADIHSTKSLSEDANGIAGNGHVDFSTGMLEVKGGDVLVVAAHQTI